MDEKLETLIEKLSFLLNSSEKVATKKSNSSEALPNTSKPSTKKPERLPELPPRKNLIEKPEQITKPLESWPLYKDTKNQHIINQKSVNQIQSKTKNIIIDWEKKNCASIKTAYKNLGTERVDPASYSQKYNSALVYQTQMPNIADEVKIIHGIPLAADLKSKYYMELEGDIHALSLIDLDKEGLSEYKTYLNKNTDSKTVVSTPANVLPVEVPTTSIKINEQKSKFSSSSSLLCNTNSSTSSMSSTSSSVKFQSETRTNQVVSPLKRVPAVTPAITCKDAKACLKFQSQIEVETLKHDKPVPIVKHSFNNTHNTLRFEPRQTVINLQKNMDRNLIKKETIKQVSFKEANIIRQSITTIPEINNGNQMDKGTPLPSTPLPAPVRAMLNSISALNNKNYTADTVPTTPAAFSTPIPVVSLPPLPLPVSKTPPRTPARSPAKSPYNKSQTKVRSPLKIGHTSLKQVFNFFYNFFNKFINFFAFLFKKKTKLLKIYLKKQFQNKELPDKAALTS